jgi:hypothetical protein
MKKIKMEQNNAEEMQLQKSLLVSQPAMEKAAHKRLCQVNAV